MSCDWAANGNSVGQPKCKRKKIYYKRWFSSSASFLERQVLVSPPNTLFFSVWPLFRLTKHDACHNGGKKLLGLDFSHCTCHNGGKILGKHRNNEIFEFGYPLFSFCLKKGFSSVSHALDLFFTPLFSYFLSLKPPLSPPNSFIGLKRHVFSVFNVFIFLMPFKHTYLAIFSPSSLSQASESLWLVFKGVFSLFLMSILISDAFWVVLYLFPRMWACLIAFFYMYRPFFLGILFWGICLWLFGFGALFSAWLSGLSGVVDQGDAQWSPTSLASLFQGVCQLPRSFLKTGPLSECSV